MMTPTLWDNNMTASATALDNQEDFCSMAGMQRCFVLHNTHTPPYPAVPLHAPHLSMCVGTSLAGRPDTSKLLLTAA